MDADFTLVLEDVESWDSWMQLLVKQEFSGLPQKHVEM
jgi:hypothetical protein